jgi:DnaJ homologue, subfamily C, member 28, conserved domain
VVVRVGGRKPPGTPFETWVELQIREAQDRGEFDDLPGAGKPIPGIGEPDDEHWWVRQKLRRENLSYLPPTLALRKEVEQVLAAVPGARSESAVREMVDELNRKIAAAIRTPPDGPPLNLMPLDVDEIVESWRQRQAR